MYLRCCRYPYLEQFDSRKATNPTAVQHLTCVRFDITQPRRRAHFPARGLCVGGTGLLPLVAGRITSALECTCKTLESVSGRLMRHRRRLRMLRVPARRGVVLMRGWSHPPSRLSSLDFFLSSYRSLLLQHHRLQLSKRKNKMRYESLLGWSLAPAILLLVLSVICTILASCYWMLSDFVFPRAVTIPELIRPDFPQFPWEATFIEYIPEPTDGAIVSGCVGIGAGVVCVLAWYKLRRANIEVCDIMVTVYAACYPV